jgi:hypothetical protein
MENLTLEEAPPQGGAQMPSLGPGLPPQQNQQLPPQMFTTAAQLLDMTDSKGVLTLVCLNNCQWGSTQTGYSRSSSSATYSKIDTRSQIDVNFLK